MTQATRDVSVVICAYTEERWEELVMAVGSVQHQTALPREIIVVIDHNPDLLERTRAHIPGVVTVSNREARGLSGARNTGVAAAQGSIIAFMDEDAAAAPDWLEHLSAGYDDAHVLGVGGAIEPLWLSGRPKWFPKEFDWVVGCTYRGMPQTTAPVRNLLGANMSFRRSVFESIDGFRSDIGRVGTLPFGDEETELSIRTKQRWPLSKLEYEPRARVRHRVPAGRARWSYFRARCYAEGLSKARISRFVGTRDALASERAYTFRTLPQGFMRGLGDALFRGDLTGLARAGAILAGLAITTAGYLRDRAADWFGLRRNAVTGSRSVI